MKGVAQPQTVVRQPQHCLARAPSCSEADRAVCAPTAPLPTAQLPGLDTTHRHPSEPHSPGQCWRRTAALWLCREAGLRHLGQRVTAAVCTQDPRAVPVCRLAGMPRWDARVGCPGGMLQWGVLWRLSSLHREGNSYGQAAPTHLRYHQWHQTPLEEEEGAMMALFASKHRTTASSLWQILDPQVLYESRLTM